MPELPEVETIVRDLRRKVLHRIIQEVTVYDPLVIRGQGPGEFIQNLQGRRLENILRRGKAIIVRLDNQSYFVIQLMMTGQLILQDSPQQLKETRARLRLCDDRYAHYNDHRRFGRLQIVEDLKQIPYFRKLGPEPLGAGFSVEWLKKKLRERRVSIKTLLMDSTFVAGIGNIYASEILFQSHIHPNRQACQLKKEEMENLRTATQAVLTQAIRLRGTSINTYRDVNGQKGLFAQHLQVYGREDEDCPRCGKVIVKIVQHGRSTFLCPQCQR